MGLGVSRCACGGTMSRLEIEGVEVAARRQASRSTRDNAGETGTGCGGFASRCAELTDFSSSLSLMPSLTPPDEARSAGETRAESGLDGGRPSAFCTGRTANSRRDESPEIFFLPVLPVIGSLDAVAGGIWRVDAG